MLPMIHEKERIYSMDDQGRLVAEITFPQVSPGLYCIDHTFVDSSLRGQGAAGELVRAALQEIEALGGTATATCSYAVRWMEAHNL